MFNKKKNSKKSSQEAVVTSDDSEVVSYSSQPKLWIRIFDFFWGAATFFMSLSAYNYIVDNISSSNELLVMGLSVLVMLLVFCVFFVPWFLWIRRSSSKTSSDSDTLRWDD